MFKKAATGLAALIMSLSCSPLPYRPENNYYQNAFTRESAKAALQDLLRNRETGIVQTMAGPEQPCCLRDCIVDDEKFSCQTVCWMGDNPTQYPSENYTPAVEYHQIEEAVCSGEEAVIYLRHPLQAKKFAFPDETSCHKLVDALTYLKLN